MARAFGIAHHCWAYCVFHVPGKRRRLCEGCSRSYCGGCGCTIIILLCVRLALHEVQLAKVTFCLVRNIVRSGAGNWRIPLEFESIGLVLGNHTFSADLFFALLGTIEPHGSSIAQRNSVQDGLCFRVGLHCDPFSGIYRLHVQRHVRCFSDCGFNDSAVLTLQLYCVACCQVIKVDDAGSY